MPRRQSLRRRRRLTPLVAALYLNAGLLACLLLAFLVRGSGSTAFAAPAAGAQPIAGGNGLYLMPGQFSNSIWGCYVMDVDRQTLCAYEYIVGRKQLQLVASRYFGHDLRLRMYNTTPDPDEVDRWGNLQDAPIRGNQGENGNEPPQPAVNGVRPEGPQLSPGGQNPDGPADPGGRPLDRPPQPGDPDYVPKASDINNPPAERGRGIE